MGEQHFYWKAVDSEQAILSGLPEIGGHPSAWERASTELLHDHLSHVCSENKILFFEDMRINVYDKLLARCKNERTVHLVRRPSSVVVSNWAYTRNLKPGQERVQDLAKNA